MRTLKTGISLVILLGGLVAGSKLAMAKPESTKKEKKACVYCHLTATSKELNEAGKYCVDHGRSLEGYQPKKGPAKSK